MCVCACDQYGVWARVCSVCTCVRACVSMHAWVGVFCIWVWAMGTCVCVCVCVCNCGMCVCVAGPELGVSTPQLKAVEP